MHHGSPSGSRLAARDHRSAPPEPTTFAFSSKLRQQMGIHSAEHTHAMRKCSTYATRRPTAHHRCHATRSPPPRAFCDRATRQCTTPARNVPFSKESSSPVDIPLAGVAMWVVVVLASRPAVNLCTQCQGGRGFECQLSAANTTRAEHWEARMVAPTPRAHHVEVAGTGPTHG